MALRLFTMAIDLIWNQHASEKKTVTSQVFSLQFFRRMGRMGRCGEDGCLLIGWAEECGNSWRMRPCVPLRVVCNELFKIAGRSGDSFLDSFL